MKRAVWALVLLGMGMGAAAQDLQRRDGYGDPLPTGGREEPKRLGTTHGDAAAARLQGK